MSSKGLAIIKKWVDQTFQLDRLDHLATKSVFISAAYSELIANINYCMLMEDIKEMRHITIANIAYPVTMQGRKAAIAESFRHMANKLDDFLSVANITSILGSIDFIADVAKAAVPTTSTIIHKKAT